MPEMKCFNYVEWFGTYIPFPPTHIKKRIQLNNYLCESEDAGRDGLIVCSPFHKLRTNRVEPSMLQAMFVIFPSSNELNRCA